MMKKKVMIVATIIVLFAVVTTAGFFYVKSRPIPAVQIGSISLENVDDGAYTGEYKAGLVRAVVEVKVASHKITGITIKEHENGLGKKAEVITKDIEKAQSLDVDVISGATLSSKVIVKAVEIALEQGRK